MKSPAVTSPRPGGRTLVAVAAFMSLAAFYLPWVLVLYELEGFGEIFGLKTAVMKPYFVVLDASGYDLAFGRIADQEVDGETKDVEGSGEYLALLIGPAVLLLATAGHALLRPRDRRVTPIAVALAAILLAGFLLDRMYLNLEDTIRVESAKRRSEDEEAAFRESFQVLAERAVPRLEIGFWMALFGYAGVLSGSILWYREGLDAPDLDIEREKKR